MPGEEQVAQYELDGFLIVEDLLSEPELETIRRRIVDIVEGRTDFPEEYLEFEPNAAQTRHLDNIESPPKTGDIKAWCKWSGLDIVI